MKTDDEFFIGWSATAPRKDRRFMLGAGLALLGGAGALGAALGGDPDPSGLGFWDQGKPWTLSGRLALRPYPLLRTRDLGENERTVFLATSGKTLPKIDAALDGAGARLNGTMILRGDNAMMAVDSIEPIEIDAAAHAPTPLVDRGAVLLVGEILDAKCWFGAMRPGYGKTHKACASLCARGGLPLAFCQLGACGEGAEAPLLLNEKGVAFGREILPLVADPVAIKGRLVDADGVRQIRAALADIKRV
jgi:hypothetical protein